MSGIPQFNYPAFMEAAANLRREDGDEVLNPAELDDPKTRAICLASETGVFDDGGVLDGQTWGDFLSRDVKLVADEVDGVCLLPGWRHSRGARLEAFVALTVGKPVFYYIDGRAEEMGNEWIVSLIAHNTLTQGNTSRYGGNNES